MRRLNVCVGIILLLLSACGRRPIDGFADEAEAYESFVRYYATIPATCPGQESYRFDAGITGKSHYLGAHRWMFEVYLIKVGDATEVREQKYVHATIRPGSRWERTCPPDDDRDYDPHPDYPEEEPEEPPDQEWP